MGIILRTKAEGVGCRNRAGRDAEDIAHDAAHARICTAEGFERRGMIVGFGFEGQVELIIEGDNTRVIHERGVEPLGLNLRGSRANVLVE